MHAPQRHRYSDPSLPVTARHDIYPTIDPKDAWTSKSYAGKVVLITGASRGIGQILAVFYAKAGAFLALVARSSLEATEKAVRADVPDAKIVKFAADVTGSKRAREIVQETVKQFGHIDIVIPNAGAANPLGKRVGEIDPEAWWSTFEVNIKGAFNFVSPALEHIEKSKGRVVFISSCTMNMRVKTASDYMTSKLAISRLVEFIAFEYPNIPVFAFHPGSIATDLSMTNVTDATPEMFEDTLELAAGTALLLTSGRFDWLSGKYIDANWDLGEVERDWKEKILAKGRFGALVAKLALP
ncbi:NAD(P)-binding protein [Peniophora sp. CONT]|nr:NAD(P)-binding protein [Peniophora sp. CONT]